MEKPELLYEEMVPGKEFSPLHLAIDSAVVDLFLKTIEEHDSVYNNLSLAREWGFERPLTPHSIAAVYARSSYLEKYTMPGGGILAKQEFSFFHWQ